MTLRINEDALLEPAGMIPADMKPALDMLGLDQMESEVNMWACVTQLASYVWDLHESTAVVGIVMIGGFVMILTCADMLALVIVANQIRNDEPATVMKVARVLGKMSMLDVFCMGVIVVSLACVMYQDMG